MLRSTFLILFALVGCGESARSSDTATGASGDRGGTETQATNRPPEGVRVRAESFANGDVNPIVEATGGAEVSLRGRLGVERLVGDDWTNVDGAAPDLRADCATPAPDCVTLARGGGLRPPRWNARARGGQCDGATTGSPLASGRYRFVATSCDGNHRVEGVPFDVTR